MSDLFTFSKPKWNVVEDKKVFETPIFSLHEIELIPDKIENTHPFYVLNAPEWINVIALTADHEIVLVEQYRAGIDEVTLEIPGGMVDRGESPAEAAQRELLEETGFRSKSWTFLGKTSSNPAILSNYTHLYLAENCEKTDKQHTDGSEDIRIHKMPMKNFLELVSRGVVHHSIVLAAVAQYLLKKGK
ncbi:MAG: NUDIX hydrolase [Balneolaceae bacterium]|nr:NUDIX hydrolase [Balneolaceae bacterium]